MYRNAMWLCLGTAVLWAIVVIRDIFAPGFFTMSPRNMSKIDMAFEFAVAAAFLVAAVAFNMRRRQSTGTKSN
jgi:hypothetical protein